MASVEKCARERPRDDGKCAVLFNCGVWHCGTGARTVVWRMAPVLGRVLGAVATWWLLVMMGSDFFCPSGWLGERKREFSLLYKGRYWA